MAVALVFVAISCAAPAALTATRSPAPSIPRCTDGRPQAEIDHAGALPFPLSSAEIVCVANADSRSPSHDRFYRLRDGRMLHVYENTVPLQAKPTAAPLATGRVSVARASWSWSVLDNPRPVLVLQVDRADIYVELDLPISERDADLRLLQSIAATIALP